MIRSHVVYFYIINTKKFQATTTNIKKIVNKFSQPILIVIM